MVSTVPYLNRLKGIIDHRLKKYEPVDRHKKGLIGQWHKNIRQLDRRFMKCDLGDGFLASLKQLQRIDWTAHYTRFKSNLPLFARKRGPFRSRMSDDEVREVWEYLKIGRNNITYINSLSDETRIGALLRFLHLTERGFAADSLRFAQQQADYIVDNLREFDNLHLALKVLDMLMDLEIQAGKYAKIQDRKIAALWKLDVKGYLAAEKEQDDIIKGISERAGRHIFGRRAFIHRSGRAAGLYVAFAALSTLVACASTTQVKMTYRMDDPAPLTLKDLKPKLQLSKDFLEHKNIYLYPQKEVIIIHDKDNPQDPDQHAPIVIILRDVHGSPINELDRLEAMRTSFGINFVGVEGWAGHETDRERGYRLLNAESDLITEIIDSPSYRVIPLEEGTDQELALKLLIVDLYILIKKYERLSPDQCRKIWYQIFYVLKKLQMDPSPGDTHKVYQEMCVKYRAYNLMNMDNVALAERTFGPRYEKHVVIERSCIAVDKLISAMDSNSIKVAVMVIGAGHLESVINEFQIVKYCNLMIF
ncbi:MAG: hypothetical protein ABH879_03120 [archaeon]